jgi:hypothetical protein
MWVITTNRHCKEAWFIKGVDDQAIHDFSKTIAIVPFHQGARIFRSALYRENSEYDKALSDLNTLLEICTIRAFDKMGEME